MSEEKQKPKEITTADLESRPGALTPFGDGGIAPRDFTELVVFAKMIANSGMLPKSYEGKYEGAVVAMQMGAELGLTPMAAVRSICVINGQPSIWGDGLLALVKSDPRVLDVIERSQKQIMESGEAECTVKVRNRVPVTCALNMAWAKKAGLLQKKGPWQNYPERMLQMRARAFACRDAVPDRLSGIACAEEAGDIIDMGAAEYIDPATAVPPEGTRKFGKKPEPEPEEQPARPEGPAASMSAEAAVGGIESVPNTAANKAYEQLRQVAALDTRSAVVNAAQAKLQEIEAHRAGVAAEKPAAPQDDPRPAGAPVGARNGNPAPPGPGPDMPPWDEGFDPETGEIISPAEAEDAARVRLTGAGF